MMQDIYFDDLADRLEAKIYNSIKGKLRLELLWHQLKAALSIEDMKHPLQILDIGGGFGQLSGRLAELGHQVTLAEPASSMLQKAQQLPQAENITFIQSPLQNLHQKLDKTFDLVLCHAVLEWLAEPQAAINPLLQFVKPSGHLSLATYNLNTLIYKNLIYGNLRKIKKQKFKGDKGSLTPQNPLKPDEVESWLVNNNMQLHYKAGVRSFTDMIDSKVLAELEFEDLLAMELIYHQQEPYCSLARYIHTIWEKEI